MKFWRKKERKKKPEIFKKFWEYWKDNEKIKLEKVWRNFWHVLKYFTNIEYILEEYRTSSFKNFLKLHRWNFRTAHTRPLHTVQLAHTFKIRN